MHIESDEYRDAGWGDTRNLFEADTLVAELAVSKLLFGRRLFAQMGNRMRIGCLLCKQQQQDQQAIKDAMPFHVLDQPCQCSAVRLISPTVLGASSD